MRKMAIIGALAVVAAFVAPANAVLVVNGDWSTGDETGWTQWASPWGGNHAWSVDAGDGNPAPAGKLTINDGAGGKSFGWYQAIPAVVGQNYTITGDWSGSQIGWIELMFFSDDGRPIYDQLDAPVAGAVIAKRDAGGLGGGPNFGWQSALNSQQNPNTQVATAPIMYVGLKVGAVPGFGGFPAVGAFDNITVVPEPATLALLGLPMVVLFRRRRHA